MAGPAKTGVVANRGIAVLDERRRVAELGLIQGRSGAPVACEHNAVRLLGAEEAYASLHFDEFRCRVRLGDRDWTDHDDRMALCKLQEKHRIPKFTLGQVRTAVQVVAYERRRDALREYVRTLPAWDRTPRIELAFSDAWGAPDTDLTRAASRNLFIAMIARALKPGAQVDTLWAFEGPQGTLKSRSLRALGGEFHAEVSAPIGSADFQRELRGLWLAEISELESLRGREASTVKRFLSAPVDRLVEKWQVHATSYPRRAVAVATTNEAAYWQDPTGARRLVPIRTGEIDLEMIEANREQWFAEALERCEAGATWWEFPESISAEQEDRQRVDPWEDLLRRYIANGREVHRGHDHITHEPIVETVMWPAGWISSSQIARDWLQLAPHQQGQNAGVRLGQVMRRLGFLPQRQGKARERGWVAVASKEDQ